MMVMMMMMMMMVMMMMMMMMVMMMMMMMIMMMMMMMMMLAHCWRPPRGRERAQRDSAFKLIAIHLAEIQNWGRC